ncbi:MAG: sodium:alanine symporter, partial [Geminicoccaceae bacterium]|nr:sodium:alanine symporter [Geminicoccaceae bacterium]
FGGIKRIAAAAEIIVPVMAVGYIVVALLVIAYNITEVPAAFMLILRSAFGLEEAFAGGMGAAIAMGVRRGLFSNEAGLGSAPTSPRSPTCAIRATRASCRRSACSSTR